MDLMNIMFKEYLDEFILVFIDDILVYSKSKRKHEQHLKFVFQILCEKKLFAKFSKREFRLDSVDFLEHIISKGCVSIDPKKVEAIVQWIHPINITKIQSFLSIAGYCNKLVDGF